MKRILFLGFTALLLATSCTVQKRLHNSGYHVAWKGKNKSSDKNNLASKELNEDEKINYTEDLAVVENAKDIENEPFVIINSENSNEAFSFTSDESIKDNKKIPSKHAEKIQNDKRKGNTISKILSLKNSVKKVTGGSSAEDDILLILLVVLCFFIPPLSVGIATDWDLTKVLLSVILSLLFWIPGVIYALYTVLKEKL